MIICFLLFQDLHRDSIYLYPIVKTITNGSLKLLGLSGYPIKDPFGVMRCSMVQLVYPFDNHWVCEHLNTHESRVRFEAPSFGARVAVLRRTPRFVKVRRESSRPRGKAR